MTKLRISVSFDENNYFWVVIDNGKLIMNPTKEDLKGTKLKIYNKTNICEFIDEDGKRCEEILYPKNARQFDIYGKTVWYCETHSSTYKRKLPGSYNNMMKTMANCRTGNEDPSHTSTKGNKDVELACKLYGYINLNEIYDNCKTPIDCQDPITGLLYQIQGRCYDRIRGYWGSFGDLEGELYKVYKEMICICKSEDGMIIERIYRFPKEVINNRKGITIVKNPSRGVYYEKYRIKDPEELKKANDIRRLIR